jgi:putative acetyltransferase
MFIQRGSMITIRNEQPADTEAIGHINSQAFGQPAEAELVEALRARGSILLSLVAWRGNSSVGHILFSPLRTDQGESLLGGAALGPMAVLLACQREGIGSRLVRRGLTELKTSGVKFVVVLGHPEYYSRFGFAPAQRFGMTCEFDVPSEVFMALELQEHVLEGWSGRVRYQPEFTETL